MGLQVFEAYLGNYSHWGYSDFDIVCGQLPRFIEWSELVDFHVVTYSFGDNEAIYLRGQWTVHANSKFVNRIWMGCKHLGKGLQAELYQKASHLPDCVAAYAHGFLPLTYAHC